MQQEEDLVFQEDYGFIKPKKKKYKLVHFICEGCGRKATRKVYCLAVHLVKYCNKCKGGKIWRKEHLDYQKAHKATL